MTSMMVPVENSAPAEARNRTAWATSSGFATRPSGLWHRTASPAGSFEDCARHIRFDESWGYGTDKDAEGCQLLGKGLGERVKAGFAGAIGRAAGFSAKGTARTDIHDSSTAGLTHMLHRVPAEVGGSREIDGECALPMMLPILVRHLVYGMRFKDAGIVDENVETTKIGHCSSNEL